MLINENKYDLHPIEKLRGIFNYILAEKVSMEIAIYDVFEF